MTITRNPPYCDHCYRWKQHVYISGARLTDNAQTIFDKWIEKGVRGLLHVKIPRSRARFAHLHFANKESAAVFFNQYENQPLFEGVPVGLAFENGEPVQYELPRMCQGTLPFQSGEELITIPDFKALQLTKEYTPPPAPAHTPTSSAVPARTSTPPSASSTAFKRKLRDAFDELELEIKEQERKLARLREQREQLRKLLED